MVISLSLCSFKCRMTLWYGEIHAPPRVEGKGNCQSTRISFLPSLILTWDFPFYPHLDLLLLAPLWLLFVYRRRCILFPVRQWLCMPNPISPSAWRPYSKLFQRTSSYMHIITAHSLSLSDKPHIIIIRTLAGSYFCAPHYIRGAYWSKVLALQVIFPTWLTRAVVPSLRFSSSLLFYD